MFKVILCYNFWIMKVNHFGGRRGLSFNLNKDWHHSHGFGGPYTCKLQLVIVTCFVHVISEL